MTRRVVEKLCTKKVCVDFLAPILVLSEQSKQYLASLSSQVVSEKCLQCQEAFPRQEKGAQ